MLGVSLHVLIQTGLHCQHDHVALMIQATAAKSRPAGNAARSAVEPHPHPRLIRAVTCRWLGIKARSHCETAVASITWPRRGSIRSEDPISSRRKLALQLAERSLLSTGRNPSCGQQHIKRLGETSCCSWGSCSRIGSALANARWCWFGFRSLFLAVSSFAVDCPGPLAESATHHGGDHQHPEHVHEHVNSGSPATNQLLPGAVARLLTCAACSPMAPC